MRGIVHDAPPLPDDFLAGITDILAGEYELANPIG
jgi:hypothetical protein